MAKPVIRNIEPFDANVGTTISFVYSGNQPYMNRIVIFDALDMSRIHFGDLAYHDETTRQLKHTVPAGVLENGKQYAMTVQCFDNVGEPSAVSDKVFFWALSSPTFLFNNFESEVKSSSISLEILYSQKENEDLSQIQFYLYDINKIQLSTSGIIYDSEKMRYTFSGLENTTIYYVRAIGQTSHGINVDTGYQQIFVKFENPNSYAMIYANEDSNGTGTVNYYTNISIIRPTRNDYVIEDGYLILNGDSITYNTGFEIDENFTLAIKHKFAYGEILHLVNKYDMNITLSIVEDKDKARYMLRVDNGYVCFSDSFDVIDDITVYLRRKNNIYDITVFGGDE